MSTSRVIIVDDSDPNIKYTGNWRNLTKVDDYSYEYLNTTHASAIPGDGLAYQWAGKQISVWGTLDSPAARGPPSVRFSIDGGNPSTFNETGILPANVTKVVSHVLLYQSPSTLEQGTHTISITVDPPSFVGAGAPPSFYFDFFTISTDCVSPFSNVIVDDKDPSVEYSGTWSDVRNGSEYMQTARMINGPVKFRFYGTSIAAYGMPSSSSILSFGGTVAATTLSYSYSPYPHTRLFFNSSISDRDESTFTMDYYSSVAIPPGAGASLDYIIYNVGNSSTSFVSDTCFGTPPAPVAESKTGSIAGGVVGGLALLGVIAVMFWFIRKRRRARLAAEHERQDIDPETHVPVVEPADHLTVVQPYLRTNKELPNPNVTPPWAEPIPIPPRPTSLTSAQRSLPWAQPVNMGPLPPLPASGDDMGNATAEPPLGRGDSAYTNAEAGVRPWPKPPPSYTEA